MWFGCWCCCGCMKYARTALVEFNWKWREEKKIASTHTHRAECQIRTTDANVKRTESVSASHMYSWINMSETFQTPDNTITNKICLTQLPNYPTSQALASMEIVSRMSYSKWKQNMCVAFFSTLMKLLPWIICRSTKRTRCKEDDREKNCANQLSQKQNTTYSFIPFCFRRARTSLELSSVAFFPVSSLFCLSMHLLPFTSVINHLCPGSIQSEPWNRLRCEVSLDSVLFRRTWKTTVIGQFSACDNDHCSVLTAVVSIFSY